MPSAVSVGLGLHLPSIFFTPHQAPSDMYGALSQMSKLKNIYRLKCYGKLYAGDP